MVATGANGEQVPVWIYKFRLHLARRGQSGVVTLYQFTIEDQSLRLKLFWKDKHVLGLRKSSGEQLFFDIKAYAPLMF